MNTLNGNVGGILGVEQDGSEVFVVRVENLEAGELIPPSLTVAVEYAFTVDSDVLTTPFPEHQRVLRMLATRDLHKELLAKHSPGRGAELLLKSLSSGARVIWRKISLSGNP